MRLLNCVVKKDGKLEELQIEATQQKKTAEDLAKKGYEVLTIKDVTYESYKQYNEPTVKAINALKIPADMKNDLLDVVRLYCEPRTRNRKKVATK